MVLTSLLLLLSAKTVTLPPLEFKRMPRLAEMVKDEAREFLIKESQIGFVAAAKKQEIEVIFDPASPGPKFVVESIDQKNYDRRAILANPTKGASITKVEVTLDKEKLKGEAEAGYFGSQDRSNLSGSPEMKSFAIDLVNRDRARAIGKAVFNAVQSTLDRY